MMLAMYPGLQRSICVLPLFFAFNFYAVFMLGWEGGEGGEAALYDGDLVLNYADKSQSS